jgi:hypothetical protein
MTTQEQVASILTGWTVTTCADNGSFWTVAGLDPYGRAHSGSRADPIELAHDLARLVEPPPVLEIDPTPEPVQPTVLAEASAGVEDLSPSAPAAPPAEEPVELTDAQRVAYAGTMLQHDRENYLRGLITVRVTQIEKARLAGRYDRNAQDRQIWGWTSFQNLSAQELPIPDDVQNAYDEFLLANAWERATKDHAAALRDAAITVELQMLEAMLDQVSEGWP